MNDNSNIHNSCVQPDITCTLTNNIQVTYNKYNDTVQLQMPKSVYEKISLDSLDSFLNNLNEIKIKEIIPSWFFDEHNLLIKSPKGKSLLTHKEMLFLKMLLKNNSMVTYSEMIRVLWKDSEEVTQNAMRLFTKNIKKKLPKNILKNFQGTGYRLII